MQDLSPDTASAGRDIVCQPLLIDCHDLPRGGHDIITNPRPHFIVTVRNVYPQGDRVRRSDSVASQRVERQLAHRGVVRRQFAGPVDVPREALFRQLHPAITPTGIVDLAGSELPPAGCDGRIGRAEIKPIFVLSGRRLSSVWQRQAAER